MNRDLVVDASVAVRWVVRGPGSREARAVLDEHNAQAITLHAPSLQRAEVANALWKYQRSAVMSRDSVESAYARYLRMAVRFHDDAWLDRTALALASVHDRSVYDCLYLALSVELGCELVTADRRFFSALGSAFPQLRLLRTDDPQSSV